jgi:hypothetical protein
VRCVAPRLRDHRRPPAIARIVAVADKPAGDEIVHPYVDATEPRRLRRESLAIYGFEMRDHRVRVLKVHAEVAAAGSPSHARLRVLQ